MKKFVAITHNGAEYMYRPSSAHAVPISRATIICEMLNHSRFMLKNGEKWHIYETGGGEVYAENQRFGFRSGHLVRYDFTK